MTRTDLLRKGKRLLPTLDAIGRQPRPRVLLPNHEGARQAKLIRLGLARDIDGVITLTDAGLALYEKRMRRFLHNR